MAARMTARILAATAAALMVLSGTAMAQTGPTKEKTPVKKIEPAKDGQNDKKEAAPAGGALKVGSPAPKLSAEKWLKGEEVKGFEPGKVYVVEFWATWCGPCLKSIPHLTDMQKKHKELVVIGMASSEQPDAKGPDKREANLAKFVKGQGAKMDYRVAYDSDSSMSKDWMQPAGQRGIPCAFVVGGDGKLAFVGHPMDKSFDTTIEKSLSDAGSMKKEDKKSDKKEKKKEDKKDEKKKEDPKNGGFLMPEFSLSNPAFAFEPPADEKMDSKKDGTTEQPKKAAKAGKVQPLSIGDKAPKLEIGEFVKGEQVKEFETGKIYVVEFWATWCPPCIESIPHLSEMNTKFKGKGVTFIGISDETTKKVKPFVEKMGDKMNYTVAIDAAKRATNVAFMEAAGQNGIPTAFIVDKEGRVVWIGHPMDGLDKALAKVVDGTFDLKKEAAAGKTKAENAAKVKDISEKLGEAYESKNYDDFCKHAAAMVAIEPESAKGLEMGKFHLLVEKNDGAAAAVLAGRLADKELKDDAEMLNDLAWTILDEPGLTKRDLDVALRIASRAAEVSKNEDGQILDTLARAYFDKGDIDKAIETQTKAVEKADKKSKSEIEATLEKYKAAKSKK